MFCFSLCFIERVSRLDALPMHVTWKEAEVMQRGKPHLTQMGKCEYFLFDVLEATDAAHVFVRPREAVYAPLKNKEGDCDVSSVTKALQAQNKALYRELTGKEAQVERFELSYDFLHAAEELKKKLRSYTLSEGEYLSSEHLFCYPELKGR
jgi:UDP-N-acetylglucosamine pyrophosphorylase